MTCGEMRQYLFAFLDNELDAMLSMEMQQHLEHCPVCARECEIENVVRRQLASKLQQVDNIPEFDESALVQLFRPEPAVSPTAPRKTRRYWKLAARGTIAAALVFAVTFLVARREHAETRSAALVDALVDDFERFVSEAKPLQIVSKDATAVSEWLRDRTALAVSFPIVNPAIGSLAGGRKCKINGTTAAFAVYRVGGELASVVALRESDEALARMKRIDRNGHTHWVGYCRGHTVLACRRGELIYAIVSRLTEASLFPLMPAAEG